MRAAPAVDVAVAPPAPARAVATIVVATATAHLVGWLADVVALQGDGEGSAWPRSLAMLLAAALAASVGWRRSGAMWACEGTRLAWDGDGGWWWTDARDRSWPLAGVRRLGALAGRTLVRAHGGRAGAVPAMLLLEAGGDAASAAIARALAAHDARRGRRLPTGAVPSATRAVAAARPHPPEESVPAAGFATASRR